MTASLSMIQSNFPTSCTCAFLVIWWVPLNVVSVIGLAITDQERQYDLIS